MNAAEAYELALMHIQLSHELGEAVNRQLEFWISVSYGVLVLAFVAPQALNRYTLPLIVVLYVAYSIATVANAQFDLRTAHASMADARILMDSNELALLTWDEKVRAQNDASLTLTQKIGALHLPGLFAATLGYVCFAGYRNWRGSRPPD